MLNVPGRTNNKSSREMSADELHIRKLARVNFKLAIVSTITTLISLSYTAVVNSTAQPPQSPNGFESLYLFDLSAFAGKLDIVANSTCCLMMTTSWMPQFLKDRVVKVKEFGRGVTRTNKVGNFPSESEVSTLGGGVY